MGSTTIADVQRGQRLGGGYRSGQCRLPSRRASGIFIRMAPVSCPYSSAQHIPRRQRSPRRVVYATSENIHRRRAATTVTSCHGACEPLSSGTQAPCVSSQTCTQIPPVDTRHGQSGIYRLVRRVACHRHPAGNATMFDEARAGQGRRPAARAHPRRSPDSITRDVGGPSRR